MPRLRLDLAYMGTKFAGWQAQEVTGRPHPRTVQAVLEEAAGRILGQTVRVQGASRTDSGVHALGQVAHLDIPEAKANIDWQLALNDNLPHDVVVTRAAFVPDSFDARFDARSKIYVYRLWRNPRYVLPQVRPFVWRTRPVDLSSMEEAAAHLIGTLDFASFRNQGCQYRTTVRTLYSITLDASEDSPEAAFTFHGEGFLKQMVRNIMGCLVNLGLGKLRPEDVPAIRDARDRRIAPITAPAQGLTLKKILYEEDSRGE